MCLETQLHVYIRTASLKKSIPFLTNAWNVSFDFHQSWFGSQSSTCTPASDFLHKFLQCRLDIVRRIHQENPKCSIIQCHSLINCVYHPFLILPFQCCRSHTCFNQSNNSSLTLLSSGLDFIHMPCNCMQLSFNDMISHTQVIWINFKSYTFNVLKKLLVMN